MNRKQIDLVTECWRRATSADDALQQAIAERLVGTIRFRLDRARWIIDAVTRMAPSLDRPATFAPLAGDLLTARAPVTMDELGIERAALLGALEDLVGATPQTEERGAWEMAIGLFAEIVSSVCLDPFGDHPEPGEGR